MLAAITMSPSAVLRAQGSVVHATVADATTGVYILDAEVTLDPLGVKRVTDYFGDARFAALSSGRYVIHARRLGFAPLSATLQVSGTDSLEVTLLMAPVARELATITVDAGRISPFLREFEARRRQGKGQYITDSVLRAARGRPLEDILTSRLRGLMVIRRPDGSFTPFSGRGDDAIGRRCMINVYWNGMRITRSDWPVVDISPESIGGIEFYHPGSIPVEYQDPGNDCGVLLLWPRP